ncbi:MAG TPA: endonuclease MutS2, partial [Candidatus Xenobia bacterium]
MDPHTLRVLEFDTALSLVAGHATCELGRARIQSLRPHPDLDAVRAHHGEVQEAISALDDGVPLVFGGLTDIGPAVDAAARAAVLDARSLLAIGAVLGAGRQARKQIQTRAERAPRLAERSARLADLAPLEKRLSRAIGPDAEILDTASAALERIRHSIRALANRVQQKLGSFLRDPGWSKMMQEPLVTTREDRYVLPIRQEYRGLFPGIVLDASASGATVFMEPLVVVDLGNSLRQAQLEEKREIESILRELSGMVGQQSEAILDSVEEIAWLDGLFAAARYAIERNAHLPHLNELGFIRLTQARHPLLRGDVVPVDIEVGGEFHTLIITGPNTGGKTVTLKTVGLMTLLGLCGLPLPASPHSEIPWIADIFADIGDEQAIVQNLSTFSSHISHIVRFLPQAGPHTLILMDELGTGTDPREGTGLALSILEYLHTRSTRTVVTTHYSELKSFGATWPGAVNASVEFDEETLRPTYRVLLGLPGRSCALIIAERLGVPGEVLDKARLLMGEAHFEVEDLVEELEQQRAQAEAQSDQMADKLRRVQQLQEQYEAQLRDLRVREAAVLEQAVKEGELLVESAREELKAAVRASRQKLSAVSNSVEIETAARTVRSTMEQVMERLEATREIAGVPARPMRSWTAGDRVRVPRLHQTGTVVAPARGQVVQVMVGKIVTLRQPCLIGARASLLSSRCEEVRHDANGQRANTRWDSTGDGGGG